MTQTCKGCDGFGMILSTNSKGHTEIQRCDRCQDKGFKEQERCYFDSLADQADNKREGI